MPSLNLTFLPGSNGNVKRFLARRPERVYTYGRDDTRRYERGVTE